MCVFSLFSRFNARKEFPHGNTNQFKCKSVGRATCTGTVTCGLSSFSCSLCSSLKLSSPKPLALNNRPFFLVSLGGVRLSPLGTSATVGLLYQPKMIDDDYGAVGGMRIGRGNRSTRRKPAPKELHMFHFVCSDVK
jgi:hypothetical protein